MDQERYEKKIILANDASAANNAAAPSKPVGDGGEEDPRPPNGPETIHVNAAAPTPAPTGKPTLLTATSVRILDPNGVPIYLDQPARSRRCGLATKSAVMVYAAALVLATAGILAVRLISTEQPTPEAAAVTIQMPTPLRTGDPTKIPAPFPTGEPTSDVTSSRPKLAYVSWGEGDSFCSSDLNVGIEDVQTAEECWQKCSEKYPQLVAIDFETDLGGCWCQDSCPCMDRSTANLVIYALPDVVKPVNCDTTGDPALVSTIINLPYTYSYPNGKPPGCCGGYYDDPNLDILNSNNGEVPNYISQTNSIEWNANTHDWGPVLDLGSPQIVTEIRVSYIAIPSWGKYAPKSLVIKGSLERGSNGTPWMFTKTWTDGFPTAQGGHTVAVPTLGWGAVQYIELSEVSPSEEHSVVSRITVHSLPPTTEVNGEICGGEVVIVSTDNCVPGEPHFDQEGSVCRNDDQWDEAYCSYDVGPTACAYCLPTDSGWYL